MGDDPVPNLYPNSSTIEETSISFCGESSIHGDTVGLQYSISPLSKSPGSELQAGYNTSDSLQSRSRAESSSAFCEEELRHGIQLDCEQNEQSRSVAGHEERRLTSAVSSPESTIQMAARVLSNIFEPTKWTKNA